MVELAGIVLAAGAGTRLRPLTTVRPKALCTVAAVALVDHAIGRLRQLTPSIAVNVHYQPDAMLSHLSRRPVHVSHEKEAALGSSGALGFLKDWIGGRAVLVTNADTWMADGLRSFFEGWDGVRTRLLVEPNTERPDFDGRWRYVGAALMPWTDVAGLSAEFGGLYSQRWRDRHAAGLVEFLPATGKCVPCDTPAEYLHANLVATDGGNSVEAGATIEGAVQRSVIWADASVKSDESLVEAVRANDDLTLYPFRP